MNTLTLVVFLLFSHYIGDYLVQTRKQAKGKSTDLLQLFYHVSTYTFTIIGMLFLGNFTNFANTLLPMSIVLYGLANFGLHFVTDYFTSRAVKRLWDNKEEYKTFAIMGLDQFIHCVSLISTIGILHA